MIKDNTSGRTRFLHLRLTPAEIGMLEEERGATTCRGLSEYARRKLFDRPIVATIRNRSIDEMMYELIRLRKDLNDIVGCFSQSSSSESAKEMLGKIVGIKLLISKMGDEWLQ